MGDLPSEAEARSIPLILIAVPAAMLAAALAPWPYGYYVLLRLVVCIASVAIAWRLGERGGLLTWAFVALAILYNPIVRVPLGRDVWMIVNLMSLAPFAWLALRQRNRA
jgi:hypothetical protein